MVKKIISIMLLLLVFVLIETALLSNIDILPAVPDLLLILVLYLSIHNGSLNGEVSGFFSVLFLDFLSVAPLGLNCLLRTIIGFVVGLFKDTLNVDCILIPFILGFIATIFKVLLLEIISFFFPHDIITYQLFSVSFVVELVLNTLLTPILFSFLSIFSSFLINNISEKS